MSTSKELWARIGDPQIMPLMGTDQDIIEGYKEGLIDEAEVKQLLASLERRTKRYEKSQGYEAG